jgi:hypothetical protein
MKIGSCALVLSFFVGTFGGAVNAAEFCAHPDDYLALNARHLQTELMVAALSCNANDRYNAFVTKFQTQLLLSNRQLVKFFSRRYGASGANRTNEFVTMIANQSSERSLADVGDFCAAADKTFDQIDRLSKRDFEDLVLTQSPPPLPRITICTDTMQRIAAQKSKRHSPQ